MFRANNIWNNHSPFIGQLSRFPKYFQTEVLDCYQLLDPLLPFQIITGQTDEETVFWQAFTFIMLAWASSITCILSTTTCQSHQIFIVVPVFHQSYWLPLPVFALRLALQCQKTVSEGKVCYFYSPLSIFVHFIHTVYTTLAKLRELFNSRISSSLLYLYWFLKQSPCVVFWLQSTAVTAKLWHYAKSLLICLLFPAMDKGGFWVIGPKKLSPQRVRVLPNWFINQICFFSSLLDDSQRGKKTLLCRHCYL